MWWHQSKTICSNNSCLLQETTVLWQKFRCLWILCSLQNKTTCSLPDYTAHISPLSLHCPRHMGLLLVARDFHFCQSYVFFFAISPSFFCSSMSLRVIPCFFYPMESTSKLFVVFFFFVRIAVCSEWFICHSHNVTSSLPSPPFSHYQQWIHCTYRVEKFNNKWYEWKKKNNKMSFSAIYFNCSHFLYWMTLSSNVAAVEMCFK